MLNGKLMEDQFVFYLNGKKYEELLTNFQDIVKRLFPFLDRSKAIYCSKFDDYIKPDICIWQGDERKNVSLKTGTTECVHTEHLNSFIDFLKECGIDDYSIETYLLYHYGDGTTDGTGKERLDSVDVRYQLKERFVKLNEVLNSSKDFIKKFADRVMWQGCNKQANMAEYIYYGDIDYGHMISRKQFFKQIDVKKWDFMTECVHVGPFIIRPRARFAHKEIKSDEKRRCVSINYPRLHADIAYISRKYVI